MSVYEDNSDEAYIIELEEQCDYLKGRIVDMEDYIQSLLEENATLRDVP